MKTSNLNYQIKATLIMQIVFGWLLIIAGTLAVISFAIDIVYEYHAVKFGMFLVLLFIPFLGAFMVVEAKEEIQTLKPKRKYANMSNLKITK